MPARHVVDLARPHLLEVRFLERPLELQPAALVAQVGLLEAGKPGASQGHHELPPLRLGVGAGPLEDVVHLDAERREVGRFPEPLGGGSQLVEVARPGDGQEPRQRRVDVAAGRLGPEEAVDDRLALVEQERLGDLVGDREDRVESAHRLLEDHRDAAAPHGRHPVVGRLDPPVAPG